MNLTLAMDIFAEYVIAKEVAAKSTLKETAYLY